MRIKLSVIFITTLLFILFAFQIVTSNIDLPELNPNTNRILYNGSEIGFSSGDKKLDSYIINNITYVPLRSFANILGKNVDYIEESKSVKIADIGNSVSDEIEIGSYFEYTGCYEVSIVRLLSDPEKYENKVVEIGGIINIGFEDDYLFLTREDRGAFNKRNAISLNFRTKNLLDTTMEELEKYSGAYAFVKGKVVLLYPETDEWMLDDITLVEIDEDSNIHTQNIVFREKRGSQTVE